MEKGGKSKVRKIKFDYSRLRGRIIGKYGTFTAFATATGQKKSNLSAKLSNHIRINFEEVIAWSAPDKLDIPPAEIHAYFLTPKSSI
jgi:hypothetical protein